MVHLMALHLVGLSVDLVQAFQFLVSNRHYGAVARMEVHANGIVYDFEILQIGAFRKLILAFIYTSYIRMYLSVPISGKMPAPSTASFVCCL